MIPIQFIKQGKTLIGRVRTKLEGSLRVIEMDRIVVV